MSELPEDEGPVGTALAMWDQIMQDLNGPQGWWSVAQLRALVIATMKRDAGLVCLCCLGGSTPTKEDTPYWWHTEQARGSPNHRCNAGPIHDEITRLEKAGT